jgi:adenylosuccinate lyase
VEQDEKIQALLSESEINTCFDPQEHLQNLDVIYQRLGI